MSIRPIDSQMMITRATDFVKEASVEVKKSELAQEFSAIASKAAAEQEKKSVGMAEEAQEVEVNINKDSEGYGGGGKKGKSEDEEDAKTSDEPILPVGLRDDHRIDISV